MRKLLLIAAGLLWAGTAWSDEVIIQHRDPVVVEPAPSTSTTTVERHGPDCDSKSVHRENGAGDSETVTRKDCD